MRVCVQESEMEFRRHFAFFDRKKFALIFVDQQLQKSGISLLSCVRSAPISRTDDTQFL